MIPIIHAIERLSIWTGRSFGWCILILTLSVAYEVFVRYVVNAPTVWAFDMMVQMYGALFLVAGPYALAQDTHVRADVVYRFLQPRWQALVDIILYILFFFSVIRTHPFLNCCCRYHKVIIATRKIIQRTIIKICHMSTDTIQKMSIMRNNYHG